MSEEHGRGGAADGEPYDGGPVAALRRIAFLLERGREETYKVKAFRERRRRDPAAAGRRGGRARRGRHPHRPARASAPSTAQVIADAGPRRAARAAGHARGGARRAARPQGGQELRARAARRPALALRLVRRRLADRGDGVHRDRARPRLPRAHRPLAAADRRQRAERRAADPPARRRRRGQRAPRRRRASRCSRASRSTSSTTAPSTRPTRCWPGSTSGSPACTPSCEMDAAAMTRRMVGGDPQPAHQRARPLHRPAGDGQPRHPAAQSSSTRGRSSRPAPSTTSPSRSTPGPSAATRRPSCSSWPATSAACSRSTATPTRPGQLDFLDYGCERAEAAGIDPDRIVNTWPRDRLLAWANRVTAPVCGVDGVP